MFCEKCGKRMKKKAAFCSFCGEKLPVYEKPIVKKKYSPFTAELRQNFFLFIFPIQFFVWRCFGKLIVQLFYCDVSTVNDWFRTILWIVTIAFFGSLAYVASKRSSLFDLLYILPYLAVCVVLVVIAREEYDELFSRINEACLPFVIICAVVGVRALFSKIKHEIFLDILSLVITNLIYVMFSIAAIAVMIRLSKSELEVFICNQVLGISLVFLFLCFVDYVVKMIKYRKKNRKEKLDETLL